MLDSGDSFKFSVAMRAIKLLGSAACLVAGCILTVSSMSAAVEAALERVIYSFGANKSGSFPIGRLTTTANGRYGVTQAGGGSQNCRGGCGSVYQFSGKTVTLIHGFTSGADGDTPRAGLVADAAGNLYGATGYGGTVNTSCFLGCGTIFKITPTGEKTTLYSFTGGSDGRTPNGNLLLDAAGNVYGTTQLGGSSHVEGWGTVFKISPDGQETQLHIFQGYANDGGFPYGGLIADAAGNLYGTTNVGGTGCRDNLGCGTIYRVAPDGQETVLYSFQNGTDGASPYCRLIADAEGNLYGTTNAGGANSRGTIFKLAPDGTETILYSFDGDANPFGELVADAAGDFYGVLNGGAYAAGQIYQITPSGLFSTVYDFGSYDGDGESPTDSLTIDRQGNFSGTTFYGGALDKGTIFKLKL